MGRLGGDEFVLLLLFRCLACGSIVLRISACTRPLTPLELDNIGKARVAARQLVLSEVQPQDQFMNTLRLAGHQSMYQIKHTGKNGVAIGSTLISISRTGTGPAWKASRQQEIIQLLEPAVTDSPTDTLAGRTGRQVKKTDKSP